MLKMKQIGSPSLLLLALGLLYATPLVAADQAKGTLTVEGKPASITQVYAFAQKGFFDAAKDDVVVVLCDAALPPAAVHDEFARGDLVKAGKVHCVEQTINTEKQVINYKVQHGRFGKPEGGGSTEHVFEATTFDGKTVAGRSYTKSPQKSFDDVPYSYDVTFSAAIEPKK
jgi:hypothetical protein